MIGDSPNSLIASVDHAVVGTVDIDDGDAAALPALEAEGVGVGELHGELSGAAQPNPVPGTDARSLAVNRKCGDAALGISRLPLGEEARHVGLPSGLRSPRISAM